MCAVKPEFAHTWFVRRAGVCFVNKSKDFADFFESRVHNSFKGVDSYFLLEINTTIITIISTSTEITFWNTHSWCPVGIIIVNLRQFIVMQIPTTVCHNWKYWHFRSNWMNSKLPYAITPPNREHFQFCNHLKMISKSTSTSTSIALFVSMNVNWSS